jgi:hypothetical protein
MSDNAKQVIELAIKGAVPIIFAAVCTLAGILWNHEGRITTQEANEKNSAAQLQKIEQHLLRIEDKLDRRLP